MAFLVLVLDVPSHSITQLNAKVDAPASNPREGVVDLQDFVAALSAGAIDASVQVTTRDTDPSVSTSGSGSTQKLYNLK